MRVHFDDWVFDEERRELSRAGNPVHLSPKAFDLLAILIRERPRAVRKEELFEEIWPDTLVEQANLNNLISEVRKALEDSERSIVVTRARFGYFFAPEATEERQSAQTPRQMLRISLGEQSWDLRQGRNLVGREEDCTIIIDHPEISRYHAAIEVVGVEAVLHDLGSKNGTFLRGRRVEAPASLGDRDEIEIGRRILRFRRLNRKPSTISGSS